MPPMMKVPSSSDDEAPEPLNLGQSKRIIQRNDEKLKRIHASQKQTLKALNRQRDQFLKERASKSKKRKIEYADALRTQERMKRAMWQAEEEDEVDIGTDIGCKNMGAKGQVGEEDERTSTREDEEIENLPGSAKDSHLPDHLFLEAFKTSPPNPSNSEPPSRSGTKRRVRKKTKELVSGCALIVTALTAYSKAAPTVPPLSGSSNLLARNGLREWQYLGNKSGVSCPKA